MKRKFHLIMALVIALVLSSGVYAYAYTTATGTISIAEPTGDIATWELAPGQPPWESILLSLVPPDDDNGGAGIETLRPNAPGDETNIPHQHPKSGEHWDKVDDVSADDWETYVWGGGSHKYDLYHIPDPSEDLGTIYGVTVYFRFSGDEHPGKGFTTGYAKAVIKTYGTVYEGLEKIQTGKSFTTQSHTWTFNPFTGADWTWDEIVDLQIGVSLKCHQSRSAFCTQVFVDVDYDGVAPPPPEIFGDVPTGNLFVVTPHPDYTGDLTVKVYLLNTAALIKAYQYLNMELILQGAENNPQLFTLHNGVATFTLQGCAGGTHTLYINGGSYCLVSDDPDEWGVGWTVIPELYCEVIQR